MKNVHEPKAIDLHKLKSQVAKFNKIYEDKCKPIRHKVYAHAERESIGKTCQLFDKINVCEIQSIIEFAFQVEKVLWELMFNGRLHSIDEFAIYEGRRKKDVETLLLKIST
ncbi:MAG TPA: hypothetical protein VIZ65_07550 [Cellvibrionaceae bacterium]